MSLSFKFYYYLMSILSEDEEDNQWERRKSGRGSEVSSSFLVAQSGGKRVGRE